MPRLDGSDLPLEIQRLGAVEKGSQAGARSGDDPGCIKQRDFRRERGEWGGEGQHVICRRL